MIEIWDYERFSFWVLFCFALIYYTYVHSKKHLEEGKKDTYRDYKYGWNRNGLLV